jgi:hypothetical protein
MNEVDSGRLQIPTRKVATAANSSRHHKFHLLLIGVPRDTGVAKFNRKIPSFDAF